MNDWRWLIEQPEGQFLERKSAYDRSGGKTTPRPVKEALRDVAKALAAMANADGGTVVLRIEDDGTVRCSGRAGVNRREARTALRGSPEGKRPSCARLVHFRPRGFYGNWWRRGSSSRSAAAREPDMNCAHKYERFRNANERARIFARLLVSVSSPFRLVTTEDTLPPTRVDTSKREMSTSIKTRRRPKRR